jgi:ATP-dependent DNA helicase DinG
MSFPDSRNKTDPHRYLNEPVIEAMKTEIVEAEGREILFFGWLDEEGRVHRIEVIARGNEESVGLPLERSYLPDVIIHNHPESSPSPSQQDVVMSSRLAEKGVGFFIVNRDLSRMYVVVEPVERRRTVPLDPKELSGWVSSGGPLTAAIPNFEEREGQKEMIEHICRVFNEGGTALIEAGTGIGKSLAYLIPSLRWALDNREKVVISTNTINLQEQLLYKDIPDLQKALGVDFSYVLMKGRGNYLCFNRLFEAQQDLFSLIEEEELEQFRAISEWVQTASEETLSHLPFVPKPALWDKINSQSTTCLGGRCPYFSKCPLNRVRRSAAKAHLIVTNHHYLLADAQLGDNTAALLPPYRRVVFDEAHNLEDSATSFFTRTVRVATVLKVLNRIYTGSKKEKGYLVFLRSRMRSRMRSRKDAPALPGGRERLERLMTAATDVRSRLFGMFEKLEEFFGLYCSEGEDERVLPLEPGGEPFEQSGFWNGEVLPVIDRFYRGCSQLAYDLVDLSRSMDGEREEMSRRQIDGLVTGLMEVVETIDLFLGEDSERYVRWIAKKGALEIVVALIEVGDLLNQLVFSRMNTCVLTSATLTVGGSFEFLRSRLSLAGAEIETSLPSPFDYERQMLVLLPHDISSPGQSGYLEDQSRSILQILEKTEGKAFVLFTSYRALEAVYGNIGEALRERGIALFRQGSDSRSNLLQKFKADIHSVLFGTVSFWEGVDAPGSTLECVIITKLPFKVPTEPILKARSEKILRQGGNPFLQYQVPLAVIKLRQGIGRLIRNRSDHGIITILDPRILLKSYGALFIDSLPSTNLFRGTVKEALERIDGFLGITP